MMSKFNLTKLADVKWIGYIAAGVAAVVAFSTEMQNQQKEKDFKDLSDRVSKLENK